MSAYFLFWGAALLAGVVGALLVTRHLGLPSQKVLVAVAAAVAGFALGAKMQYRLETLASPTEALLMWPADLFEPGFRSALGALVGALAALVACHLLRLPWRQVGDGLVVASATAMIIGRIGCFVNGCCMGIACPTWAALLCIRMPRGSTPYYHDLLANPTNTELLSRPLHPLPLYYAAASLLTLVLLIALFRRGVAPGIMLATYALVRPPTRLFLDRLRIGLTDEAMTLMVALPLVAVCGVALVLLLHGARRARGSVAAVATFPISRTKEVPSWRT